MLTRDQLLDQLLQAQQRIESLDKLVGETEGRVAKLNEESLRFRILSELVSDCCWARWVDREGNVIRFWVNDAFEDLTGYTPAEFEKIGRKGLVHPEDLATTLEHVDGPLGRSSHEFRIIRRDGEVRWLRETMEVSGPGESLLVLGVTQDVTDQRRAERIQRDSHSLLEKLVGERTAELRTANTRLKEEIEERLAMQRELMSARDRAEQANRAKSRFLANVSHEIRTPLHAILGLSEALLDADSPLLHDSHELAVLHRSAAGLAMLIDDVLDFSKIEAGKLELKSGPFLLHELETELSDLFAPRAESGKVRLTVDLTRGLPTSLSGDRLRLRQVLTNLTHNALKFTDVGGTVTVRAFVVEAAEDDRVRLHFEVLDSGAGIPPDTVDSLFDPFTQGDESSTRSHGGTGLGLAISQRLTELMGGTIEVETEVGTGSRFFFELSFPSTAMPISPPQAEPPVGEVAGEKVDKKLGGSGGVITTGKKILVAEDNLVNQLVLDLQLKEIGHSVALVETGRGAVEAATASLFDLVLMDCQMPELDGFEATRRIRRLDAYEQVPIIAVTASGTLLALDRCLAAGMNDVLSKPFRRADLMAMLDKWLHRIDTTKRAVGVESSVPTDDEEPDPGRSSFPVPLILVVESASGKTLESLDELGFAATRATDGLSALDAFDRCRYRLVLVDLNTCPPLESDLLLDGMRVRNLRGPRTLIIALGDGTGASGKDPAERERFDQWVARPDDRDGLSKLVRGWIGELERLGMADSGDENTTAILDLKLFESTRESLEKFGALDEGLDNLLRPPWLEDFAEGPNPPQFRPLAEAAHKLKGTALQFGAFGVSHLCAEIESMAKAEEALGLPRCLTALRAEIARVSERVQALSESP